MSTTLSPAALVRPKTAKLPALVATELVKLRTVRAPWVLVALGLLATAFLAVQAVLGSGADGAPTLGTAPALLGLLASAARAQVVALVVGVLVSTAERRHATLTGTLLQAPHRVRVVAAKALAGALVGLLLGLASLAAVLATAVGAGALGADLVNGDVVLAATGQLLAYPLYGLLGVGIGAVLASAQPLAVALPVAWLLLLESYLGAFAHGLQPWLPGTLTAALGNSGDLPGLVPVWAGGLGVTGYGVLFLTIGAVRWVRADVH